MQTQISRLAVAAILIALSYLAYATTARVADNWLVTALYFTWDGEFLKRGLPAQVFHTFGVAPNAVTATILSQLATGVLVVAFLGAALRHTLTLATALVFCFLLFAAPTLLHLLYDAGRFDAILYCLALATVLCARLPSDIVSLALVAVLQVLALVTHEAALFMSIPLSLALYAAVRGGGLITPARLAVLVVIGASVFLIFGYGGSDTLSLPDRFALYQERYGPVNERSLMVLYRSVSDNVGYTLASILTFERGVEHLVLFFAMLPYVAFLFVVLQGIASRYGLVALGIVAPLLLYPIGQDHFRWWSLVFINMTFATMVLYAVQPAFVLSWLIRVRPSVMIAGLLISLVLGPLGVTNALPRITGDMSVVSYVSR